jgi:hypothetical protein
MGGMALLRVSKHVNCGQNAYDGICAQVVPGICFPYAGIRKRRVVKLQNALSMLKSAVRGRCEMEQRAYYAQDVKKKHEMLMPQCKKKMQIHVQNNNKKLENNKHL